MSIRRGRLKRDMLGLYYRVFSLACRPVTARSKEKGARGAPR
jgi:hypothetical protein